MNAPDTAAQVARERALDLAEKDLAAINVLLESPGWAYLKRRLEETRDALRADIADCADLTGRQTRALRAQVRAYNEIIRLPAQDRIAHTSTIAQARQRDAGPSRG